MDWNPLLVLLAFGLIIGGIVLVVLEKQKFSETTATLQDCVCYNQANLCECNGTYEIKGTTIQSGLASLPGNSKDGDTVKIWVDTGNPYNATISRPVLEIVGYVLIAMGALELVILVFRNL